MGRPKDEVLWNQVDGTAARWVCKHCHGEFAGSATRIRNHLSGVGNDISGCAFVPSHIRDEALKKNTTKRRPSSSASRLRISSSSTASPPPPQHDPPPSSSNDPDPVTKSAEVNVRDAFMKMLMAIGVSDAVNHPTVREFCKRAHQHGVPLSLLGNDPFVIGKSLSNIKHEVYKYMLMVKESWKTTGCTLITYNLSEKKENFTSRGEGMDVIGFYCPKGFIFMKAPPINGANFDVEIFKDALKQHQPSLEADDLICLIKHRLAPIFTIKDLFERSVTYGKDGFHTCEKSSTTLEVEYGFPLCETSEYVCIDICPVSKEIGSVESCSCLRRQIQRACMEGCGESEWANSLIYRAVRLHKLLLKRNAVSGTATLGEWYYGILAKKGEKIPKFVDGKEHFQEVHLSIFLLIMRLAVDMQHLNQQESYLMGYKNPEMIKFFLNPKFWIEGRKLALVLTLILRIPDIMDTLVPTSGYLGMALHKVESVLLEVNKSSIYGITKADEAFHFWTCLRNTVELCPNSIWSNLNPRYILQEENVNVLRELRICLEGLVKKEEELPQLRKDVECYRDVFRRFSDKIQLNNLHPVKLWQQYNHDLPLLQKYAIKLLSQPLTCMCNQVMKHIYQLQEGDDYILRLNVRMMEEFKVLGDDIYNPIDVNAWEWIPAELRTSEPKF